MRTTIKGYDDDSENDVSISIQAVDGVIVAAVSVGTDDDSAAWMRAESLREIAREALEMADRIDAANKALAGAR